MKGPLFSVLACLLVAPAAASDVHVGPWLSTSDKDPITGEARARAQANNPTRPPAFLQVRCHDRLPTVLVGNRTPPFGESDRRWVVLKIDDAPPAVVPMVGLKATRVLAARLGRDTYGHLVVARRVAVRVLETDGSSTDAVYPLTRTAQAMKPVLALCPIDSALDRAAALYDPSRTLPPTPPAP